jgi:hypothetical protein
VTAPTGLETLAAQGWEAALIVGMCEHLAGSTGWVYSDDLAGTVQLSPVQVPDQPDRVCVVNTYGDAWQDGSSAIGGIMLQLRFRSRRDMPLDVKALAAQAFDLLHGATGLTLGGVRVDTVYRDSYAELGRDSTRRWERTDNYQLTVALPATSNRQ